MSESYKHNTELKKACRKEDILYGFINVHFKAGKSNRRC